MKSIIITSWVTFACLCYMAVTEGLNLILGIALLTNIISNIINIIYLKKEEERTIRVLSFLLQFVLIKSQ